MKIRNKCTSKKDNKGLNQIVNILINYFRSIWAWKWDRQGKQYSTDYFKIKSKVLELSIFVLV